MIEPFIKYEDYLLYSYVHNKDIIDQYASEFQYLVKRKKVVNHLSSENENLEFSPKKEKRRKVKLKKIKLKEPFPRTSLLSKSDLAEYFCLLEKYKGQNLDNKALYKFKELHGRVSSEQIEYQKYLEFVANQHPEPYQHLCNAGKAFLQDLFNFNMKRVLTMPKYFAFYDTILLPPSVPSATSFNLLQRLHETGYISRVVKPNLIEKCSLNKKYDAVKKRFDYLSSETTNLEFYEMEDDPVLLDLCERDVDIAICESSLKCLFDNHGPQWSNAWEIVVKITEVGLDKKKFIFINKNFLPKNSSTVDQNKRYSKYALRASLIKKARSTIESVRENGQLGEEVISKVNKDININYNGCSDLNKLQNINNNSGCKNSTVNIDRNLVDSGQSINVDMNKTFLNVNLDNKNNNNNNSDDDSNHSDDSDNLIIADCQMNYSNYLMTNQILVGTCEPMNSNSEAIVSSPLTQFEHQTLIANITSTEGLENAECMNDTIITGFFGDKMDLQVNILPVENIIEHTHVSTAAETLNNFDVEDNSQDDDINGIILSNKNDDANILNTGNHQDFTLKKDKNMSNEISPTVRRSSRLSGKTSNIKVSNLNNVHDSLEYCFESSNSGCKISKHKLPMTNSSNTSKSVKLISKFLNTNEDDKTANNVVPTAIPVIDCEKDIPMAETKPPEIMYEFICDESVVNISQNIDNNECISSIDAKMNLNEKDIIIQVVNDTLNTVTGDYAPMQSKCQSSNIDDTQQRCKQTKKTNKKSSGNNGSRISNKDSNPLDEILSKQSVLLSNWENKPFVKDSVFNTYNSIAASFKKEKSTDCDSALIPLLCVHG